MPTNDQIGFRTGVHAFPGHAVGDVSDVRGQARDEADADDAGAADELGDERLVALDQGILGRQDDDVLLPHAQVVMADEVQLFVDEQGGRHENRGDAELGDDQDFPKAAASRGPPGGRAAAFEQTGRPERRQQEGGVGAGEQADGGGHAQERKKQLRFEKIPQAEVLRADGVEGGQDQGHGDQGDDKGAQRQENGFAQELLDELGRTAPLTLRTAISLARRPDRAVVRLMKLKTAISRMNAATREKMVT